MTIQGIIFDFDGLICDTESTELHAWEKLYADYGVPFPFEEYQKTIGAVHNDETPLLLLKESLGSQLNINEAREKLHQYHKEVNEIEPLRPGVLDYLKEAKLLDLKIGLASSSPIPWVGFHLDRLGISHFFECIRTFEDVHQTKPNPQLFLLTLECLNLAPVETIALEDSINGIVAAKSAGLLTVAVPNAVTSRFDFKDADIILSSLEEIPLRRLIEYFNEQKSNFDI
ncbi:MAG: HAD-IA family hydrolase [Chloroflexi bacterium]|nr:HAD-IA family hydrolase [Chloroflexota bacterium]